MSKATCKTCGAEVPNHVPSLLDSQGIGAEGHRIFPPSSKPTPDPAKASPVMSANYEEQVRAILSKHYVPDVAGVAAPEIAALIENISIQSRIDELKHTIATDDGIIYYTPDPTNPRYGEDNDISQSNRIVELKAQLKESTDE